MKVAIFTETYFPFISGVVTHIKTLKESLEHAGHEVLIVTTSPKAVCHYVKDGVLYCPAIPLKRIYGYGLSNPVNIQRLRIIQDFDPDIIHIHTEFSMGIFAQFAARKLKSPSSTHCTRCMTITCSMSRRNGSRTWSSRPLMFISAKWPTRPLRSSARL